MHGAGHERAPARARAGAGPRGRARSGYLLPPLDVADLGCGEGYLTIEASALGDARRSPSTARRDVLKRARALADAPAA